jgi:hypothetical protein
MITVASLFKYLAILALLCIGPALADEPSSDKTANDCEVVGINYQDNPELTRAEKLALMEEAFYESLKKFEDCNLSAHNSSSSNANGSAAAGSSGGDSAASEAMQGTEAETEQEAVAASDASSAVSSEDNSEQVLSGPADNGKIPEDIPPAENDDAIAAQIRIAAEAETDPEVRKKLWNEYRKYKGMNVEH